MSTMSNSTTASGVRHAGDSHEISAKGWFLVASDAPLEERSFTLKVCDNEVIVQVAGCGLCHTDLGFLAGHVKTKQPLPIILGHEISGKVVAAGVLFKHLLGKSVIVPAVLPCGECELCQNSRDNICQNQKMPGNDFNGGFATHVAVPGKFLCVLPDSLSGFRLPELSVIADAVTTPYQSAIRSQLAPNDVAIVIGVGGIGIYMVQHARNARAHVAALDIDEAKLAHAKAQGASFVLNVKDKSEKEIKDAIRTWVSRETLPKYQWKIFETSGTPIGQATAFSLLTFASTLGVVGFTMEKVAIRLSNAMAFDATIFGNWGCRPAYYPDVVKAVLAGQINIRDNIEEFSMSQLNDVIAKARQHQLKKRPVMVP